MKKFWAKIKPLFIGWTKYGMIKYLESEGYEVKKFEEKVTIDKEK